MVADFNGVDKLLGIPFFALFGESCFGLLAYFDEVQSMGILRHHKVAEMAAQSCDEDVGIEAFFHDLIECKKHIGNSVFVR